MKLLLCRKCSDIRALFVGDWVACRCGRCKARYRADFSGEVCGEGATLLGFANPHLIEAIRRTDADRDAGHRTTLGHCFEAFVIPHAVVVKTT